MVCWLAWVRLMLMLASSLFSLITWKSSLREGAGPPGGVVICLICRLSSLYRIESEIEKFISFSI